MRLLWPGGNLNWPEEIDDEAKLLRRMNELIPKFAALLKKKAFPKIPKKKQRPRQKAQC